ncbi:ABC transporter ATP-binding protein [Candidatus Bealeia paramacronuclearis]|uniref:ABC transporter ATP-binding protein n=1 Tax=Candidatus Bealeia paramacronuclearis TaxID=1921001 RepID=A0ABZ2C3Z3_9PROT|nr:ABC transporter ATP-binding protein [Candidatus Bealeia paramacronuclearis]
MSQKNIKIQIRNLSKSFGHKVVLNKLNLDIYEGESLVIIGGSGTGKSVLIKCILGLIQPDSGEILIDGKNIVGESVREQTKRLYNVSTVFQGSALFDSLKVWENVAFGLINAKGMSRKDAQAIALENLASVGLDAGVGELFPSEISGGMQRRVALARAIATAPSLIFFDEPTAGLDPIFCGIINDIISKNVKDLKATAVTITHDMASARHVADRIAMIHEGHIIWSGPASGIDHSGNPYVEQFVTGSPKGPIHLETIHKEAA